MDSSGHLIQRDPSDLRSLIPIRIIPKKEPFIHNSISKHGVRQQHLNCSRIASAHSVLANFCNFDFQLRFPGQISIRSYCNGFLFKTSVITFYSKGDTVIFLISTLILQHNLFVTQFINYCILSRTVFYLLFIAEAIVFLVAFALTSRANRQTPFTLTTKNVLQFTLRRRTVDLVKKNVKGKFQTFCKGMFCFHTGR